MIRHQVTSLPVKNVEDKVMDKMISVLDIMSIVSLMDVPKSHFEVNHVPHARDSIVGEMEWKQFAEIQQAVFSNHNIQGVPSTFLVKYHILIPKIFPKENLGVMFMRAFHCTP